MISCIHCHSPNLQKKGFNSKGIQRYRCKNCRREFNAESISRPRRNQYPEVIECPMCGTETTNPKFCSISCATRHNNRLIPKRTRKKCYCKYCGVEVEHRRTTCEACNPNNVKWSERTVGELRRTADYQANARIRNHSRVVYKASDRPRCCQRCGYNKYYEVCHIHAISEFPDEALVKEVNDISNLIGLCPNCHWEFDHGLLGYEDGMFVEIQGVKRYSHVKKVW